MPKKKKEEEALEMENAEEEEKEEPELEEDGLEEERELEECMNLSLKDSSFTWIFLFHISLPSFGT